MKKKQTKSFVWRFFKKITLENKNNISKKEKVCQCLFSSCKKTISNSGSATSAMINHLKTKHSIVENDIILLKKKKLITKMKKINFFS
jgi:hypothetical protein